MLSLFDVLVLFWGRHPQDDTLLTGGEGSLIDRWNPAGK